MSKLRKRLTIVILAVFASLLTVAVTGFTTKAKAADINLDGETFEIADKVSLKLNEDGGMRWVLRVSDNVYNYVKDTESVEMGFVIAPKVLMDKANGDYYGMAQRILIPIDITKGYRDTGTTDTDWYFNGCVVKMNDVNRKYDYTAAAYIKSGDTVLKQTTINTNSVNNFYNVANKSILYSGEDYSEKMLGLESYKWLGTEEFPIKVETADLYNSLVEKINAGRDFSDKIIEIGKSVDRSGATLNEGYALPTGTREVCDGDSHAYTNGICVNCNKLQTVGVQYLENADKGVYYVAGYTGLDKEVYILSEYNGKPVTYVANGAFKTKNITKVVLPDSVKSLDGNVFEDCKKLEYVSMTGVENLDYNGSASGYGADRGNNFMNCTALKYVILSPAFTTNCQQFFLNGSNPEKAILDIYVNAASGTPNFGGANTNLLTGNVYYKVDDTATVKCMQWKFGENGEIVKGASSHDYVDGKCSICGAYNTMGVAYGYDSGNNAYYVADNRSLNLSEVTILEKYNDGTNGEASVIYVQLYAFHNNTSITKITLPESVTELDGSVFMGCTNLKYVSMTGVKTLNYSESVTRPYSVTVDGNTFSTRYGNNNFYNCVSLETVIVSNAFSTNVSQFGTNIGSAVAVVRLFVNGASGTPSLQEDKLLTGEVYYKADDTATVKCMQWKFGENGEIVKGASSHTFVDGKCSGCGKVQTEGLLYALDEEQDCYYVSGYNGSDKEIYVLSEYNGKPVTYIKNSAFFENTDITKVILPTSIKRLDGGVFQGCGNLEYVSMLGIEEMLFAQIDVPYSDAKVTTNNNFIGCTKLTVLIVGEKFNLHPSGESYEQQFLSQGNPACIDVYVYGTSVVNCSNGSDDKNGLLTGNVYYYSETSAANSWHYVNGVAVLWA